MEFIYIIFGLLFIGVVFGVLEDVFHKSIQKRMICAKYYKILINKNGRYTIKNPQGQISSERYETLFGARKAINDEIGCIKSKNRDESWSVVRQEAQWI